MLYLLDVDGTFGAVHAHLRWVQREVGAAGYFFATTASRKKPLPTMLNEAMYVYRYWRAETVLVGDAATDYQAAQAAEIGFEWANRFFGWV